jgi:catechol 2,3-dioxygenase-like lactoylglutathione lyase family enzyme
MLKIKNSAAAIPAQDIKRARQFYEQKLGLKPAQEESDGGAMYQTGETAFLVFLSTGKASGDHTQMAIEVEDVVSAASELKSKGVKFEEYDHPNFKTKDGLIDMPDGSKGGWFKDTEGNLIALTQRVPAQTPGR